jgi:predicted GNAT superfamily acetyltransferase
VTASEHDLNSAEGGSGSEGLSIRPITDVADLSQVEAIQREVWMPPTDLEIVPTHLLIAVASQGGVLLGAFRPNGDLLGFVFGFLAHHHGRLCHHSHMMGVRRECRDSGLGLRLKLAQRQAVLDCGLDLITWTYDPLEGRNAHLNLNKLGAVCRTYARDMYGEMQDGLNQGMPTDRFLVEWELASSRVQQRLQGTVSPPMLDNVLHAGAKLIDSEFFVGDPDPEDLSLPQTCEDKALCEIPRNYQQLRGDYPLEALRWRLRSRELFERYFSAGFAAVGLVRTLSGDRRRNFYLLERDQTAR